MISVVIGAILAALFAGLLFLRVRYGSLRVSEFPALLWCLLSGPDHRRQLRGVLLRREQRAIRASVDGQVAAMAAGIRARRNACIGCGVEAWHGGKCPACHQRAKRGHVDHLRPVTADSEHRPNLRWERP